MRTIYSIPMTVAAVAFLAFSVPMPASSQMKDMSMKDHGGGHGEMMEKGSMDKMGDMMGMCMDHADKIGLTAEQTAKMKPMHSEMQKRQARYRADLKIAEIELSDITDPKDFDLDKASSAVKKIQEIRTTHQLEMLKSMKEMRTLLTEEQFNKMKKMMPMQMGEKKPHKMMMKK